MKIKHLCACLFVLLCGFFSQTARSQCFQIESILVDACGTDEGLNEMVRLKVGNTPLNISNFSVNWPNNSWTGLVQNATTAQKVATLNADILAAGGCGELIQPTGGTIPANATVILVTSYMMSTFENEFGAITEDIYILFQNNPTTSTGHFANSGTGNRTLSISSGGCTDSVTYNRALLVNQTGGTTAADGATVLFSASGQATYINNGCSAPVPLFTVEAGNNASGCAGNSVSLSGQAQGHQSVSWSAASGTFSAPSALNTTYTIPANASGTVVVTLTATNSCGAEITDTVTINVTPAAIPNFATTMSFCQNATVPTLATVSPNGISGTWNPGTISNQTSGNYVFTPNPNQCAVPVTLSVTISNSIVPNFTTTMSFCQNATVPTLATVSPNGISGTWSPGTISNQTSGNYVFTPNPNQCAVPVTLSVTISNSIVPNFTTTMSFCQNATVPTLATVSPNGISGTWSPATISNQTSGNYVFTPNPNQCAVPVTLSVTISNSIVPNFTTTMSFCQNATVPALATVSPNGISGTWNPGTISNQTSGNYVFTPNPNQCAVPVTLSVTISNSIVPNFATTMSFCQNATVPTLATVSPNGISGTWSPATISNQTSGNYVFTPNPNQCAVPVTLSVTISNSIFPNFATTMSFCQNATVPVLATVSPNGISGTWSPGTISNQTSGNYVFTPNPNQCAVPVTLSVTISNSIVPNFTTTMSFCQNATVPALATVSPNGISGTWSPGTISNQTSGNYVFTPNPNQCAVPVTLSVTISNSIVPNFTTTMSFCQNATVPTLATVSPNGISGTWSPGTISNQTSGNYVFTPNPNQCAVPVTLSVTISNSIFPNFATTMSFCQNATVPTLATVSPNGISGTWNPGTISNQTSGNYVFTPNPNQCAVPVTLSVTISNSIVPNFATTMSFCQNATVPTLATVSPNGISGTWSPGTISNQTSGNYVFTPNPNQCTVPVTLSVTIDALPPIALSGGVICVDPSGQAIAPLLLETGLSDLDYGFVWTLDGAVLSETSGSHSAVEAGIYSVTATQISTGCSRSGQATVTSAGGISIAADIPRDFSGNGTVTVHVDGGSGDYSFMLDGELMQDHGIFHGLPSGEHTILVRDVNGCDEEEVTFFLLNYPKFFTPNADGFHDTWNISGLDDQQDARIYLFDRYGKLLKTMKPSSQSGWDGSYNGHALPSTDYWFVLEYRDRSGNQKEFKAHFSLKR
ncbi:T9SS type B sorting domain-containing protein [Flavobacterium selenitireducens]|uniref:T9SS type B sorting domain-containing protein n=1 Tax=Flavobacterium selenitireducens TaxID=2722704 RepID=UPI00168C0E96|nr:T9SS type B sorting domain-containing protein [Flavobacterium selenitireducens]MBD3581537.1 T9SS type B sorting domain-containing protein [Flavobacterium selenitireducens]